MTPSCSCGLFLPCVWQPVIFFCHIHGGNQRVSFSDRRTQLSGAFSLLKWYMQASPPPPSSPPLPLPNTHSLWCVCVCVYAACGDVFLIRKMLVLIRITTYFPVEISESEGPVCLPVLMGRCVLWSTGNKRQFPPLVKNTSDVGCSSRVDCSSEHRF